MHASLRLAPRYFYGLQLTLLGGYLATSLIMVPDAIMKLLHTPTFKSAVTTICILLQHLRNSVYQSFGKRSKCLLPLTSCLSILVALSFMSN